MCQLKRHRYPKLLSTHSAGISPSNRQFQASSVLTVGLKAGQLETWSPTVQVSMACFRTFWSHCPRQSSSQSAKTGQTYAVLEVGVISQTGGVAVREDKEVVFVSPGLIAREPVVVL